MITTSIAPELTGRLLSGHPRGHATADRVERLLGSETRATDQ